MSFFLNPKHNTSLARKLLHICSHVKSSNCRQFASKRRRKIDPFRRSERAQGREKNETLAATATAATIEGPPGNIASAVLERIQNYITPLRFHTTGSPYTREQFMEMLRRFPLWLLLSFFAIWEGTAPVTMLSIRGPSMLPTMAADGSEIWLARTRAWHFWGPFFQVGDLVGFAHPDHAEHVSCKRVVGVAGDRVKRYGEYASLYVRQDPANWGQQMPPEGDGIHDWIDRSFPWDRDYCERDKRAESMRTIIVPPEHVWLESDCPALGVDSRQHGPVPDKWVRGRVVGRLWPWLSKQDFRKRPHPIPLDTDTLLHHNVHNQS